MGDLWVVLKACPTAATWVEDSADYSVGHWVAMWESTMAALLGFLTGYKKDGPWAG